MYQVRAIKTPQDYEAALARVDELWNAEDGTSGAEELDVITTLIESYEDSSFPTGLVSPLAAIRFRMDQQGLTNKDLVPYIGSANRVSEVLNGKRTLTLAMIRALHENLGIPADVLIKEPGRTFPARMDGIDWDRFPISEMAKRGWIATQENIKDHAEELVRSLIEAAGGMQGAVLSLRRKNDCSRRNAKMDSYALHSWCLHVLAEGRYPQWAARYNHKQINLQFLSNVTKLSTRENGPEAARRFLADHGIALVLARHLPRTYLDGAAMMAPEGHPVIGMTLRHDRLDSFWFCLLHELAHVGRHLRDDAEAIFVDDLDLAARDDDFKEHEADEWANEASIPETIWNAHAASQRASIHNICSIAQQLGIAPAIVAGRVRHETGNYARLGGLIGNGEVRKHFAQWK